VTGSDAMAVPSVVLSHRLGAELGTELARRLPDISVVTLPEDGSVPERGRDASVLYRAGMSQDALRTALAMLPELRWIHTASAGFNWLLIPEVVARPITLTRTATVLNTPIAEYAVGVSLALLKRLPAFLRAQAERRWERGLDLRGLDGTTLGVLGAGAIGRAAARRFRAFGMRTLGIKREPDPLPEFDEVRAPSDVDRLVREADVLLIACPLTPETRHMIGARQFQVMRPTAIVVNVARGEVVVEEDLVTALQEGRIAGAALDVFANEPLPEESPIWNLPNVIVTPHVSYLDPSNLRAGMEEFLDNLRRFRAGEPLLHQIKSRELGY
jgi:phosphoglycerate dehydrogenase-like enzyme